MGDLVLKGSTSGQITVTPTAIAGTNTLTLPAKTGNIITSADSGTVTGTMLASATVTQSNLASNVAGNGPAFAAYLASNQSVTSATATKVVFDTEYYDTNNNFASGTFTPTVAGYYQISASVYAATIVTRAAIRIYKNGSLLFGGPDLTISNPIVSMTGLVYCNGSTDYVDIYCVFVGTTPSVYGASNNPYTWVTGALMRSA